MMVLVVGATGSIGRLVVEEAIRDGHRGRALVLVATTGAAQQDLAPLFAALDADPPDSLDAALDTPNMPLEEEPQRVRDDLDTMVKGRKSRQESSR